MAKALNIIKEKSKQKTNKLYNMKTYRNILAVALITVISFTNFANAANLDDDKKGKKQKEKIQEEDLNLYYEDPTPTVVSDFTLPQSTVNIKVMNLNGDLIMEKEMSKESFFSNENTLNHLPKNSLFVVFYNNTAYYVLDTPAI